MQEHKSYPIAQLLSLKQQCLNLSPPHGLLTIVLNGNTTDQSTKRTSQNNRVGSGATRTSGSRSPQRRNEWNRAVPALAQSDHSFSVARKKKTDKSQTDILVGDMRSLLNKVTGDNYDLLKEELAAADAKLHVYANELDEPDKEEFLTEISKLFVRKAQIDHSFGHLYAGIAGVIAQQIDVFADILYEVCRESIPTSKYDPDRKLNYIGALILLIALRKNGVITSGGICATFERLMTAIERCDPTTVFSVQTEGDMPTNPAEQTELCIEIICKVLPLYMDVECPDWVSKHLAKLRALQQPGQNNRIKPRTRFMLIDFFKVVDAKNL